MLIIYSLSVLNEFKDYIISAWDNHSFKPVSTWQDWASIAGIVQLVVVIVALLYTKRQIEEASRARHLSAITQLLNEIGAQRLRKARNRIYNLTDEPIADISQLEDEFIECVKRVAVAYDRIGFLIKQNLFPSKSLFDFQQDEIGKLWQRVAPIIAYIREKQLRPHYCMHFEYLATDWLKSSQNEFYPKPFMVKVNDFRIKNQFVINGYSQSVINRYNLCVESIKKSELVIKVKMKKKCEWY